MRRLFRSSPSVLGAFLLAPLPALIRLAVDLSRLWRTPWVWSPAVLAARAEQVPSMDIARLLVGLGLLRAAWRGSPRISGDAMWALSGVCFVSALDILWKPWIWRWADSRILALSSHPDVPGTVGLLFSLMGFGLALLTASPAGIGREGRWWLAWAPALFPALLWMAGIGIGMGMERFPSSPDGRRKALQAIARIASACLLMMGVDAGGGRRAGCGGAGGEAARLNPHNMGVAVGVEMAWWGALAVLSLMGALSAGGVGAWNLGLVRQAEVGRVLAIGAGGVGLAWLGLTMALMGSERAYPHAYEANPGALFFWLANLPLGVGLAALAVYPMRSASSSRGSGWLIAAGLFLMLGAGGMVPIFTSEEYGRGLVHLDDLPRSAVPDRSGSWALRPPGAPRSEPDVGSLKRRRALDSKPIPSAPFPSALRSSFELNRFSRMQGRATQELFQRSVSNSQDDISDIRTEEDPHLSRDLFSLSLNPKFKI